MTLLSGFESIGFPTNGVSLITFALTNYTITVCSLGGYFTSQTDLSKWIYLLFNK